MTLEVGKDQALGTGEEPALGNERGATVAMRPGELSGGWVRWQTAPNAAGPELMEHVGLHSVGPGRP